MARIEVALGETVVAARDITARCAYAGFAACPSADHDSLIVDTLRVPDGRYPVTLRVIDAAGNRSEVHGQIVNVRNLPLTSGSGPTTGGIGPQIGESGSPGTGPARVLTAAFATSTRTALVAPFGRRVWVRGRLTGLGGSGLSNARVDVFERRAGAGARETAADSVQTGADGTFSYVLARARPSRTVRFAYGNVSRSLELNVRAASTLRASLHGTLMSYSGRVMSVPLPRGGKVLRLQGKAPGYGWTDFAALRTDRRGRFSGKFRLQARRRGVRLQIRAVVPVERGYPYLKFTGRPLALRVR